MPTRTEDELRKLLEKELPRSLILIREEPDPDVSGSEGVASWHDYDGVTYGDNAVEQQIIDRWLLEVIGEEVEYKVERVRELNGNGRCQLWFKRKNI